VTDRVGFIGRGVMGAPMARHLLAAGYPLTVHSRSAPPVDALVGEGARGATTPAEVASVSDIVITMLPDTPDVELVLFGQAGVAEGAADGSLAIDMSTIDPIRTRAFAERLAADGVAMLDAPVSGGQVGAEAGRLSIMVGGPEDAFARTAPVHQRPNEPTEVTIGFQRGIPVAIDGAASSLADVIRNVDVVGGRYGFGRVDMIENRRVGIKSRELYEVPGALALILAHRALEDLTLEREVAHFKPGVERRWSELVYDGQWFSPLRMALDEFVEETQRHVDGEVRLRLSPGSCSVVGRRSTSSLYDLSLATYGGEDAFDQRHAEGFVKLWGLPLKVWTSKQGDA